MQCVSAGRDPRVIELGARPSGVGCAAGFCGGGEAQWPVVTIGHAGNPRLTSRARPYARSVATLKAQGHPGGARRVGGAQALRAVFGGRTQNASRDP
jgi:hypothetical protein